MKIIQCSGQSLSTAKELFEDVKLGLVFIGPCVGWVFKISAFPTG